MGKPGYFGLNPCEWASISMKEIITYNNIVEKIDFPSLGDDRGNLVVLQEIEGFVPFNIKRVYYLFNTKKGVIRGKHAHKNLTQLALCVKGSCRFVFDDGEHKQEVLLNSSTQGVLIRSMIWREMHDFSPDCVLLVLADQIYDENDYIRSYSEFKKLSRLRSNS